MKTRDIIEIENKNDDSIILFKEGMFFRSYNRSAMRFVTHVRAIRIKVKFVKLADENIFYCGFPENSLEGVQNYCLKKRYTWKSVNEKRIDVRLPQDEQNYEKWMQQVLREVNGDADKKKKSLSKRFSPSVIVEKQYDLILWFLPKLANFPKDQRFLLADRIERMLLDILALLIEAVYERERSAILKDANVKIDQVRYLSRMAKDMKYISIKQHDYFCLNINEIGRMVGGWKKSANVQEVLNG